VPVINIDLQQMLGDIMHRLFILETLQGYRIQRETDGTVTLFVAKPDGTQNRYTNIDWDNAHGNEITKFVAERLGYGVQ